ncbi:hypothetical protein [Natronolimnobius baerhuensis]|uniref:Uncharacterized protein n=1 Tax=Natronolimnobius baerhuensis TaxID=253108 RepID=A0A202EAZ4_9EURY|nr:hypothetical protein [Natronolimnobius baerhuensis]OVE85397.1 hypothetical protein B2G88_00770 [Natronolimnobius baerhuensis]
MTDERTLSRRDSLKGIATTGALIGGAGIGLGTASAQETDDHGVSQVTFQQCHSLYVLLEDTDSLPINVWIRTYNAERERFENVVKPITAAHVYQFPAVYGDYYVAEFNVFQFYDHTFDAGDEILSVTIGGETLVNPNNCKALPEDGMDANDRKNGKRHEDHKKHDEDKYAEKKREIGKKDTKDTKEKHDEKAKKEKKHEKGKYDDKDKDKDDSGTIDLNNVRLVAKCVDTPLGLARYRVENQNEKSITVAYGVDDTEQTGSIFVEAKSATYFEIPAPEGDALVGLFYDEHQIDAAESATETVCVPRSRIGFDGRCIDPEAKEARFYVRSGTHTDRTFVYRVAETGEIGTVTIPDDLSSAEIFWVAAPDGEATVTLFYEGHAIGTATVDPDDHC